MHQFNVTINHIAGKKNIIGDCISRAFEKEAVEDMLASIGNLISFPSSNHIAVINVAGSLEKLFYDQLATYKSLFGCNTDFEKVMGRLCHFQDGNYSIN